MGLLDECKELYGAESLYEVLEVDKDAGETAIKRAYRTLSLKVHPDRARKSKKELATKKFQVCLKFI